MGFGVSLFLVAVGAILAFAIQVSANGISLDTIGVILIIFGLVGLLASLVFWDDWTPRRRLLGYDYDDDDIIVRRRARLIQAGLDEPEKVVDIADERPVIERRRVTTRRTTYGGF